MFAALPAYPGLEAGEGGDLAEPPLAEDARQRAGVLLVPGLCPPRLLVQGIHLVCLHHGGLRDRNSNFNNNPRDIFVCKADLEIVMLLVS